MAKNSATLKSLMMQRISGSIAGTVWTPIDFLDLGSRAIVDKTLQRLVNSRELRRIDRGLYDKPSLNILTNQPTVPDYRKVIDAIARRDQIRILLDGMTCANDLGLTNAVPGKVVIHTDGRLRPIQLDKLTITFKFTAPSKLYWAERPGMRIIQALYWLHDTFDATTGINQNEILIKLIQFLQNSLKGSEIRDDLRQGLHTVPIWMQEWLRELFARSESTNTVKKS